MQAISTVGGIPVDALNPDFSQRDHPRFFTIGEMVDWDAPTGGFLLQGALVALSNPKTLLFFGAFFPQFVDPARDFGLQIFIMGVTAMAVAVVFERPPAPASIAE